MAVLHRMAIGWAVHSPRLALAPKAYPVRPLRVPIVAIEGGNLRLLKRLRELRDAEVCIVFKPLHLWRDVRGLMRLRRRIALRSSAMDWHDVSRQRHD